MVVLYSIVKLDKQKKEKKKRATKPTGNDLNYHRHDDQDTAGSRVTDFISAVFNFEQRACNAVEADFFFVLNNKYTQVGYNRQKKPYLMGLTIYQIGSEINGYRMLRYKRVLKKTVKNKEQKWLNITECWAEIRGH